MLLLLLVFGYVDDKAQVEAAFNRKLTVEDVNKAFATKPITFLEMKASANYPADLQKVTAEGQRIFLWVSYQDEALYNKYKRDYPDAIHTYASYDSLDSCKKGVLIAEKQGNKIVPLEQIEALGGTSSIPFARTIDAQPATMSPRPTRVLGSSGDMKGSTTYIPALNVDKAGNIVNCFT